MTQGILKTHRNQMHYYRPRSQSNSFIYFLPISSYWFNLDLMQICNSKRYLHGYILLTFSLSAWNLRPRWMQIWRKVIGLPVQNEHAIQQDHISFTFFKVSFNLSRLPATSKNLVSFWTGWLSGVLEWILQNRLFHTNTFKQDLQTFL